MEVDQEPHPFSRQAEVRKYLRLVNWNKLIDRFYFDNDRILDNEIHPIAAIQLNTLVSNRERSLFVNR